jgi:nitrogen fixation NifU-like protein
MSLDFDREYFLDHCSNPRNHEVLAHPHAHAEDINPLCGDRVEMGFQIYDGRISAIYFQGRGCVVSQAAASILTEMVKGKLVQEVIKLSEDDLLDALGIPISPARSNCAFLSLHVLRHCLGSVKMMPPSGTIVPVELDAASVQQGQ